MFLACISLIMNDIEDLIMYLFTIHVSSLVKCLSNFLPTFFFFTGVSCH